MAYHGNVFNPNTGEIMEYSAVSQSSDGPLWQSANTNEIHWLAQGNGTTIHGTNTMFSSWLQPSPKGKRQPTLPGKTVPHCMHWTVRGDWIAYDGDHISTKTTDLTTSKLLFNSILSTPMDDA